MQSNVIEPSSLRQYIDMLGAQVSGDGETDPNLVRACCANIVAHVRDMDTPIPPDVFAPGVSDQLQRAALTGMVNIVMHSLAFSAKQQRATD